MPNERPTESGVDLGAAAEAFRRCMEASRDDDERAYWQRHWWRAHITCVDASETGELRHLRYTGPTEWRFLVGPAHAPREWITRSRGAAAALNLATLNPCRWLTLPRGRTARAWHTCITDALKSLARTDGVVAEALAFARESSSPGLRLRTEDDGRVAIWWRPPPNCSVAAGAQVGVVLNDPSEP